MADYTEALNDAVIAAKKAELRNKAAYHIIDTEVVPHIESTLRDYKGGAVPKEVINDLVRDYTKTRKDFAAGKIGDPGYDYLNKQLNHYTDKHNAAAAAPKPVHLHSHIGQKLQVSKPWFGSPTVKLTGLDSGSSQANTNTVVGHLKERFGADKVVVTRNKQGELVCQVNGVGKAAVHEAINTPKVQSHFEAHATRHVDTPKATPHPGPVKINMGGAPKGTPIVGVDLAQASVGNKVVVTEVDLSAKALAEGRKATEEAAKAAKKASKKFWKNPVKGAMKKIPGGKMTYNGTAAVLGGIKSRVSTGLTGAAWIGGGLLALGVLSTLFRPSGHAEAHHEPEMEPVPQPLDFSGPFEQSGPKQVLGQHTAMVLGQNGGLNTEPPPMIGADGTSVVDGKHVQDLNTKPQFALGV